MIASDLSINCADEGVFVTVTVPVYTSIAPTVVFVAEALIAFASSNEIATHG